MDVNISANTLFHFTSDRKSLLSILKSGFYIRYSLENYDGLINGQSEIVFPLVSFCDIPISQVKRHTKTYGSYAIGLKKDWGMRNGVNPVVYAYPDSTTSQILNDLYLDIQQLFDIEEKEIPKIKKRRASRREFFLKELVQELESSDFRNKTKLIERIYSLTSKLSYFIKYIKPYEGKFCRNGEYSDSVVKFYDEREWRYVPNQEFYAKHKIKDSYAPNIYRNPISRRAINIQLVNKLRLRFDPDDVRFIIVAKESEIPTILDEVEEVFGSKASHNSLKLLSTRIISLEQIIEDI